MPQASILYDYQGHAFSRFFDENRIALPAIKPVPKLLGEAVVATEDRRFYQHGGIDVFGIGARPSRIWPSTADGRAAAPSPSNWRATASDGWSAPTTANSWKSFSRIGSSWPTRRSRFSAITSTGSISARVSTARRRRPTPSSAFSTAKLEPGPVRLAGRDDLEPQRLVALEGHHAWPRRRGTGRSTRMVKAVTSPRRRRTRASKAPLALRPRPDFGGGFATSEVRRQIELILDSTTIQQGGLKIFTTIDSRLQTVAEMRSPRASTEIEKSKGETHPNGYGDPNTGLPDEDVLEGAFFAMDPATGAIRAVVGSRDFRAEPVQPRHAGPAPGRLDDQAADLRDRVRGEKLLPGQHDRRFEIRSEDGPADFADDDSPVPIRINDALVRSDL
jgi:hypothetical protein